MFKYLSRDSFFSAATEGKATDGMLRKQFVDVEIRTPEPMAGVDPMTMSRRRSFIISTASVDRDNDTIAVAGWKLENYRKNPVVLWAHDYHSLPLGKAIDVTIEGDKLVATAEFADHEMANTVLRLIDGGFLKATSVGFRPSKYVLNEERRGVDFTEQDLLEFSIVPVPANPEALQISRSAGVDIEPLKGWAEGILKSLGASKAETKSKTRKTNSLVVPTEPKCGECGEDIKGELVIEAAEPGAAGLIRCLTCASKDSQPNEPETPSAPVAGPTLEEIKAAFTEAVSATVKEPEPCAACAARAAEEQTRELPPADATAIEIEDEQRAADDADVLALDESDASAPSAEEVRQAIGLAMKDAVGQIVREQTAAAIDRMRGRVD